MNFNYKRIADPVHGTIPISRAELEILETPSFQRLRNVKQLGLAYLIYPGADYSRFSHSLGACHMAGCVLESLSSKGSLKEVWAGRVEQNVQVYRMAALLHDIGHYPFSHTMEHAIKEFYSAQLLSPQEEKNLIKPVQIAGNLGGTTQSIATKTTLKHEVVGKELLELDPGIQKVLKSHRIEPKEISRIFRKEEGQEHAVLRNLVTADLDVDRIDYLQRTAHHTSLPYGSVDIRYLISQMGMDSERRLALSLKAMRTAEHLLLGRYFDYMQVSYHKTVAGLEWLLSDIITELLKSGDLKCSAADVKDLIRSGTWSDFDDVHVMQRIRTLAQGAEGVVRRKADALLKRQPPFIALQAESIQKREFHGTFEQIVSNMKNKIAEFAAHFSIPVDCCHLWVRSLDFTETGEASSEGEEYNALCEKAVRLLDQRDSKVSTPIIENPSSVLRILGNYKVFALRLYVLLEERDKTGNMKNEMHSKAQDLYSVEMERLRSGA